MEAQIDQALVCLAFLYVRALPLEVRFGASNPCVGGQHCRVSQQPYQAPLASALVAS
jgi:hypothetical protein